MKTSRLALAWMLASCAASCATAAGRCPPALRERMSRRSIRARSFARSVADPTFLDRWARTQRFSAGNPSALRVSRDGSAVFFVRSTPPSTVRDLYALDTRNGEERVLITATQLLGGADETVAPEERARRERMRLSARGIATYALSEDSSKVLVPLSGRVYVFDRATGRSRAYGTDAAEPAIDPKFSPDAARIALVRGRALHVIEVATGTETAITQPAAGRTHATAEFVAQEEMDRDDGYWWSPDGAQLAFQETDETGVEELHIADPSHPERAPQTYRYPRTGRANAVVRLGIVGVGGGTVTWVEWDRTRFPYLANVRWTRNAPLTLVVENRAQTEVQILAADSQGHTRTLWTERDADWIDLDSSVPAWLPDGSGFLWSSERSGRRELELRSRDGATQRVVVPGSIGYRRLNGIADDGRAAWFVGAGAPTEAHVFRATLAGGGAAPEQLTEGRGEHDGTFARAAATWVHTAMTLEHAPTWRIERATGGPIDVRSFADASGFDPQVELLEVGAQAFRAAVIRPRNFDPSVRYPVIDLAYGGPSGRMVTTVRGRYLLPQWIADHGYIVVSVDGRGTPFRGRDWSRALRGHFGDVPLADQVAGLQALGERFREMDMRHVGISGWSFGGYLSALAAELRPDVFRAAIAGAPVADWRDYDTHYTERYMGMPDAESAAYDRSSLLTHASELRRPLLLVHGTADDNVYFLNSLRLADALFRAGRTFEFLVLGGMTHMVAEPQAVQRLQERAIEFFDRTLR